MNKRIICRCILTSILLSVLIGSLGVWRFAHCNVCKPEINVSTLENDKNLTLYEYIHETSDLMDRFPFDLICVTQRADSRRYRGTLTYDRYVLFARFKNKVLSSTKDEMKECVARIDSATPKEKALILTAIYIFDQTRHKNTMIHSDKQWYVYKGNRKTNKLNDYWRIYHDFEKRNYNLDWRYKCEYTDFYPYSFPFNFLRFALLLGKPEFDSTITKEEWSEWINVFNQYRNSDEIVFPSINFDDDVLSEKTISLLQKLHFYPRGRRLEQLVQEGNKSVRIWNLWGENIEKCVEFINFELELSITPEGWIAGDSDDAKSFLLKVSELEADEDANPEKRERFRLLREYWLTLQIYSRYRSTFLLGGIPSLDSEDNQPITLGEIVRTLDYNMM